MVRAFWVTAGKILANYCHVYGKMMQPTPVGTSHTLLTHTPQSTLPASSHVSTIHTGVPSQPHPHSHTHHYRILHAHASAPTVTLHVHVYKTLTFHIPTGSGTSTFSQSQVTPTHAGAHVTHSLSHSRTPNRVLNIHPALGPLWPEAGPEWSGH